VDLAGKIIQVLPEQSGQGKNGTWRKQEYILEIPGTYPKKLCFNIWGEKIDQFRLQTGMSVKVHFDVESREYNGRWYTEVKAWKVDSGTEGASENQSGPDFSDAYLNQDPGGDLPF
jgi:hypothetical protein